MPSLKKLDEMVFPVRQTKPSTDKDKKEMTDKPQTLAEQIRATYPPLMTPDQRVAWDGAISRAAALADAASTTTPVVAAEQAGDVGQAVRVRLFVDDDGDICHEPRGADMNLVALPAIDDHDGRVMHPDLFKAMVDAYNAALEPDPTPALGWRAMQTAAANEAQAWVRRAMHLNPDGYEIERVHGNMAVKAHEAILALPGPTAEQALAEAVRLMEWQAMEDVLKAAAHVLHDIDDLVANSQGVVGLHQNGDVAEWPDILEGGNFEAWLMSVEVLRAAIAKIGGAA